jgi:predicted amidophosphoribosyltransferase
MTRPTPRCHKDGRVNAISLLCDRCGNPFKAHVITPHCARCAVAWQSCETRHAWARHLTHAELVAAARQARNHPAPPQSRRRRGHLKVIGA